MVQYTNTILVTGGTLGLGYETALQIAQARPETLVVIASRSDKEKAAETINKTLQQSDNVVFKRLDLGSQTDIRNFVSEWASSAYGRSPLTALVLNAGLQFPRKGDLRYTADGIEMTFGVNHVGHALLFYLLRPHLAPDCRVVLTASGTHDPAQNTPAPAPEYPSAEDLAHPSGDMLKISGLQRYSTSKLCNIMWMYALDRHLKSSSSSSSTTATSPVSLSTEEGRGGVEAGKRIVPRWTVTAMDPGLMPATALVRGWPQPIPFISRHILPHMLWLPRLFIGPNVHSVAESAAALARLALADDMRGVSGKYFEGFKQIESSVLSYDVEKQEDLWRGTVRLIARDEVERRAWEGLV